LPDGTGLPASGEFLVVDAPSKIVQTRRYVIEARDFDHAMKLAAACPLVEWGCLVEVRPVLKL
jgi:hypothetical protein